MKRGHLPCDAREEIKNLSLRFIDYLVNSRKVYTFAITFIKI